MDWETLTGAQVRVRAPDDPALSAPIEAGPTLREVTWGVDSGTDLDALALRLGAAAGFTDLRASEGVLKARDPHGLGLVFRISSKREPGVTGTPSNPWGRPSRIDSASPVYERATPVDIGHVVLFTDRIAAAEAFYTGLGFVVSDRYPGRGIFLRCAPAGGHHNLFLLQLPNKPAGLNHVAFAVRDIHEVFGGGLHMSRCGWKTQLGPGRHPISSAYFWYFENPCGGLIEYNADEDHLTAAWQPRDFEPGPTVFAEWAIEGGLDGNTRRQPRASNPQGFLTEKRP
jgi:catechol 2,3-dioxygenase-like lactoylglutathione lyase family enzyme